MIDFIQDLKLQHCIPSIDHLQRELMDTKKITIWWHKTLYVLEKKGNSWTTLGELKTCLKTYTNHSFGDAPSHFCPTENEACQETLRSINVLSYIISKPINTMTMSNAKHAWSRLRVKPNLPGLGLLNDFGVKRLYTWLKANKLTQAKHLNSFITDQINSRVFDMKHDARNIVMKKQLQNKLNDMLSKIDQFELKLDIVKSTRFRPLTKLLTYKSPLLVEGNANESPNAIIDRILQTDVLRRQNFVMMEFLLFLTNARSFITINNVPRFKANSNQDQVSSIVINTKYDVNKLIVLDKKYKKEIRHLYVSLKESIVNDASQLFIHSKRNQDDINRIKRVFEKLYNENNTLYIQEKEDTYCVVNKHKHTLHTFRANKTLAQYLQLIKNYQQRYNAKIQTTLSINTDGVSTYLKNLKLLCCQHHTQRQNRVMDAMSIRVSSKQHRELSRLTNKNQVRWSQSQYFEELLSHVSKQFEQDHKDITRDPDAIKNFLSFMISAQKSKA